MKLLRLSGSDLTLDDLVAVSLRAARASLSPSARRAMAASRRVVDRAVGRREKVYGVTTGFGKFADVTIAPEAIAELQRNLIRSHAAGVGAPLGAAAVRAMMLLRANALAKGNSGIRVATVETLLAMLAADILPVIPSQGSVGASGDLAPLSHLALGLMGEGRARMGGREVATASALRRARIRPVTLAAKEGLALINGVQMSVAVGGLALARALELCRVSDLIGAASVDASRGSDAAFDARIVAARPHPGALVTARNLRALLAGSAIRESHRGCGRVQDNYALRCMPQVHGAARDAFEHAKAVLEREMNSATDNPLVFAGRGDILSGGNFHGAPVGLVLDYAAIAATDLASISERRIEKLVNPALSELPAFLVREGGLHSGLMMAQVTAAALVSECKILAHPASVDSIPTSAAKEDHVSMSPIAARKFTAVVANLELVLAVEAIAAFQAMEFLKPLTSSTALETVRRQFRRAVRPWNRDREMHVDIESSRRFLGGEAMARAIARLA
ncbi:MAG TPA: histidine ammonia-lyase [Thermoanaerobaculia bacterium]|jgi:histidine ammonia-lyase|nr:histidine ammonia-lyase [Thermoanaerobaculia bacterium]